MLLEEILGGWDLKKVLLFLGIMILVSSSAYAAKLPEEVQQYIENNVPQTDVRFDGVVILLV